MWYACSILLPYSLHGLYPIRINWKKDEVLCSDLSPRISPTYLTMLWEWRKGSNISYHPRISPCVHRFCVSFHFLSFPSFLPTFISFILSLMRKWDLNNKPLTSGWEYWLGQKESGRDTERDKLFQKIENLGNLDLMNLQKSVETGVIGTQPWGRRLSRPGALNLWV